jgi:hypothetical protein
MLILFLINDMYKYLYDDSIGLFSVGELHLFLLLFAVDTVLTSYSKEGLQKFLNNLHSYGWRIRVNIDKTVLIVCKEANRPETIYIFYDNHRLDIVT